MPEKRLFTHSMLGNFSYFLLSSAELFFSENYFRSTISVSNSLDPDQDRRSVGPDLGPNLLQRLSAEFTVVRVTKDLFVLVNFAIIL